MRIPAAGRRAGFDVNMTPMIDVVFLLIIFFLVSSHLARQESQVELSLPSAISSEDVKLPERPRVTINLLPQGQIMLAGDAVQPDELGRRLRYETSRATPDIEVRVRSDRSVPYRFVEPILIACARAGVWNVTFAVTKKEE